MDYLGSADLPAGSAMRGSASPAGKLLLGPRRFERACVRG